MASDYKNSGVDIEAGDETVERIKRHAKSTFNKNVLSGIGYFGAFYEANFTGYKKPVLVSSVDGVGTKLKLAFMTGIHNTIGQDLVNHCVNDIAVCGAKPLYFMDYMAFGKLNPDTVEKIVEGFAIACKENDCALIGGETAEMPGFYPENEYDISGTIVGVVDKERIINGNSIKHGDIAIGFTSTGLHTNGYSLARKVLFPKYDPDFIPEGFENTLAQELLQIHKSYLKLITALHDKGIVKGFSHITGGGITGNTKRILHNELRLVLDRSAWKLPQIFDFIQKTGNITDEEMEKVFNLGVGLVAVVDKKEIDTVFEVSETLSEKPFIIGRIV